MSGNKFTFKNKRPTTSVGLVQTEGFADIKYKGKKSWFLFHLNQDTNLFALLIYR